MFLGHGVPKALASHDPDHPTRPPCHPAVGPPVAGPPPPEQPNDPGTFRVPADPLRSEHRCSPTANHPAVQSANRRAP
eukprot:6483639-Amphidinium_carterae.1